MVNRDDASTLDLMSTPTDAQSTDGALLLRAMVPFEPDPAPEPVREPATEVASGEEPAVAPGPGASADADAG